MPKITQQVRGKPRSLYFQFRVQSIIPTSLMSTEAPQPALSSLPHPLSHHIKTAKQCNLGMFLNIDEGE